MAWLETRVMDERIGFISEVLESDYSMTELCEAYDISRKTGYKWLRRYVESGAAGLLDLSRTPHHHPQAICEKVKADILSVKQRYPHWGPVKIDYKFRKEHPSWLHYPAISTIGLLLKKEGLVCSRKRRRRASPTETPLTNGKAANDVWTCDFKGHFKTGDGNRCNPLTINDHFSRYLLCCRHLDKMSHDAVKMQFERVLRQYGLPLVIRTDNGTPFSSRSLGGLSRLSIWWIRLGIHPERIEPARPDQNGRHERMHLTLKQYTACPPAATLRLQQERFDAFSDEYNNERPHESIDMQTPATLYTVSERNFPSRLADVEYGGDMKVRKVKLSGEIHLGGRAMFLSECLGGEYVGIEQMEEDKSRLWYCNYELCELDHKQWRIKPVKPHPFSAGVNPCPAHNSTKVLPMSSV
jgi:transposase InsO family protein